MVGLLAFHVLNYVMINERKGGVWFGVRENIREDVSTNFYARVYGVEMKVQKVWFVLKRRIGDGETRENHMATNNG